MKIAVIRERRAKTSTEVLKEGSSTHKNCIWRGPNYFSDLSENYCIKRVCNTVETTLLSLDLTAMEPSSKKKMCIGFFVQLIIMEKKWHQDSIELIKDFFLALFVLHTFCCLMGCALNEMKWIEKCTFVCVWQQQPLYLGIVAFFCDVLEHI